MGEQSLPQETRDFVPSDQSLLDAGRKANFFSDSEPSPASQDSRRQIPDISPQEVPSVSPPESATEAESAQAPKAMAPACERVRLQLAGEIARGGMGVVLKARDLDLGRDIAVKVLLEGHADKTEFARRFVEEARIAGQLQHPGIAPVYQLGVFSDGRPYFTMKLVKGQTLAVMLAARPGPAAEWPRFLGIFAQVCQTLAYAHARGVIHRDLKPSNVMVGTFGEVQVMDWGLAKVLPPGDAKEASSERERAENVSVIRTPRDTEATGMDSYTQAGTLLGTPAYLAPEQARGDVELVDERADVFGLGAILCEILTGKPPFVGKGAEATRKAQTAQLEDAYARLNGCGADGELIALAKRCLAAEPWDRPRHAGEVAAQVTAYQNSVAERLRQAELARAAEEARAIAARATAAQERKARRMTLALAATVLLTMFLGGGGWLWLNSQRAARLAENNRAINEALRQATSLREQTRTAQGRTALDLAVRAREQARRAEALVESGPAYASLAEQVRGLLAELEADEKDRQLLAALDTTRLFQYDINIGTLERVVSHYREAFRAFGMSAGEGGATEAAERLAKRPAPVREAALAALDEWVARAENHALNEPHLEWLRAVLAAAEPEGWTKQVRAAAAEKKLEKRRTALQKLAETADVEHLSAQRLTRMASLLQNMQAGASAVALLRRAQVWHADDFWINEQLGLALGQQQPAEAVRYLTAAAALRADNSGTHLNLGNGLLRQGRREEAIAVFRKAIEVDPNYVLSHHSLGVALWEQGQFDEAIAELHQAIDLYPKDPVLWKDLGSVLRYLAQLLTPRGRGEEARVTWQKSLENNPREHDAWFGYAELCLYLGQEDAYRRNRRALLERFGDTTDPVIAERTSRACLLLPLSDEDFHRAAALADRAVRDGENHHFYPFFLAAKGLAEYRRERLSSAIESLQKAGARGVWMPVTRQVLTMALHRSGQTRQGQETLAAAVQSYDWSEETADSHDKWIAHILRREAEELIVPNLQPFLKGQYQPRDNKERLELIEPCRFRKRYLAAAQLYTAAFAEDAKLANDLKAAHRYNAACAAALAGCGQGQDDKQLDDKQRARWRQQAVDWLRLDLAACAKILAGGKPEDRALVRQRLQQWTRDRVLEGIRDKNALEKLPAEARTACGKLSAEFEALSKQAQ
jgi:serine/threonine-protein kinase